MTDIILKFDDDKFEQTARIVIKYNTYAVGYGVDELVRIMKDMARQYPNSITGTMGFYVASCPGHEPGTVYVAAFPAPWIIPV